MTVDALTGAGALSLTGHQASVTTTDPRSIFYQLSSANPDTDTWLRRRAPPPFRIEGLQASGEYRLDDGLNVVLRTIAGPILSDLFFNEGSGGLDLTASVAGTLHVAISETELTAAGIISADPTGTPIDAGIVSMTVSLAGLADGAERFVQTVLVADGGASSNVLTQSFTLTLAATVEVIHPMTYYSGHGLTRSYDVDTSNLVEGDLVIVFPMTVGAIIETCTVGGVAATFSQIQAGDNRNSAVFGVKLGAGVGASTTVTVTFASTNSNGYHTVLAVPSGVILEGTRNGGQVFEEVGSTRDWSTSVTVPAATNAAIFFGAKARGDNHLTMIDPDPILSARTGGDDSILGWVVDAPAGVVTGTVRSTVISGGGRTTGQIHGIAIGVE